MSRWTHITACMSVDTFIESNNVIRIVEDYLRNAPKITGSERDADVFLNLKPGHNVSTNCDCGACEYGDTIVNCDGNTFMCEADEDFQCPEGEYQTCIVITIQGDLRDRTKEETENEFGEFKEYISREFVIRDFALNIDTN